MSVLLLVALASLDAAFGGYRSSLGRTGLLLDRRGDLRANLRGLLVGALLLLPVAVLVGVDCTRSSRWQAWHDGAAGMLAVYLPFGALAVLAIIVFLLAPWRYSYLAMGAVLGPLTFLRPLVALAGGVLAVVRAADPVVALGAALAVAAVLAVPRVCDRRWYDALTVGGCR